MSRWFWNISASKISAKGFTDNLEDTTRQNTDYRRVLFTTKHMQLVVMRLQEGEEIGSEVHEGDQFIRFESGKGELDLDGMKQTVEDGDVVIVPGGTRHNVRNTSKGELKLYAIYSPPEHRKGTIQATKGVEGEGFDGETD